MVDLARAQAHHALVDHAQQFDPPGGEQPADAVAVADVERVGRGEDFAFAHGGEPWPLFWVSDVAMD